MNDKVKISEAGLKKIVYEATTRILSEGLFSRTRFEGKPQKASEVIIGNGWKPVVVSKDKDSITLRVYHNANCVLAFDEPLPFEELVEDLNIYFEGKNSPLRATGYEEGGSFIKISKTR